MNRLFKLLLLVIEPACTHGRRYVWCETRLFDLRTVQIMPDWYYQGVYRTAYYFGVKPRTRKFGYWLIHKVPYQIRFRMA